MIYIVISIIIGIISYIIYMKKYQLKKHSSEFSRYDHAIILGGSIGGMATAAYLSKYFKRITIIESDDVLNDVFMKSTASEILDYRCRLESPTSLGRSGVSQIYQTHTLQTEGCKILFELFPHLKDKLLNEYDACMSSLKTQLRVVTGGILLNQDLNEDFEWLGVDRFTLEIVLRKEFCSKFSNQIEWKCNARVTELIVDQSLNVVKGIKYRSKETIGSSSLFDLYGDFIVDCTGRNTSSPKWLKKSLNLIVPSVQIDFGGATVTFIAERFKTGDISLDSIAIIATGVDAPGQNVGFIITPIRKLKTTDNNSLGTLVTISATSVDPEYPPNDSFENFLEWTRRRLDLEYYTVLKATKIVSPILPYRRIIDERKYVESLGKKWPKNYILLGDAICTFNPQLAQGMTHALRHARALGKIFEESCHKLKDISYVFHRRASVITNECWFASTANDWKTPTLKVTETDKNGNIKIYRRGEGSSIDSEPRASFMIRLSQWYSYWFLRCASKSANIATDFMRVINQETNPVILMKPSTFYAVICMALSTYLTDACRFGRRSAP